MCMCCLTNSQICGFVRCSNSGSLWCLTLVLQFPWGCCKPPLLLASPIPALWLLYSSGFCQSREIILGSPEKPEHEAHTLLFPVTHSGKLLVFIYLVYTAGSWSSRAVCCLLFSAGPWRLDIPWSVHSLEQKPVIWAVFQSATMLNCWCSPSPGEDRTRPFCLLVHRRWQDGQRPVIARDFPVGDGSIVSHRPDSS